MQSVSLLVIIACVSFFVNALFRIFMLFLQVFNCSLYTISVHIIVVNIDMITFTFFSSTSKFNFTFLVDLRNRLRLLWTYKRQCLGGEQ